MRRIIWRPADEGDLAPAALARLQLVLDVEDGITAADALLAAAVLALGAEQLLAEHVKVGLLGSLFDDNLFPVVADLVDYPLDVLAKLELVEGADALGRDRDTVDLLVWARRRRIFVMEMLAAEFKACSARIAARQLRGVVLAVRTRIEPDGALSVLSKWFGSYSCTHHCVLCVV